MTVTGFVPTPQPGAPLDGAVTDFDGKLVDGLGADDNDVRDASEPEITHFARVAERWHADWLMVRREGGVVGRRWLSSMAAALNAGYRAAYVPGILILDAKWHCEQVEAPIVPAALVPSGAWYYWLLECYNGYVGLRVVRGFGSIDAHVALVCLPA